MPTHNAVGMELQLKEALLLTEWIRPALPGTSRAFGPMLEVQWQEQQGTASHYLRQQLGERPVTVAALEGLDGAGNVIEGLWQRWCSAARKEIEANAGDEHPSIGQPYKYCTFDPCERAAKGVARKQGQPAGPARSYMISWAVRRLQELAARYRDGKWFFHSLRIGMQAQQWGVTCPALRLAGADKLLMNPWAYQAEDCNRVLADLQSKLKEARKSEEQGRKAEWKDKLDEAAADGTKLAFNYLRRDDVLLDDAADMPPVRGTGQVLQQYVDTFGGLWQARAAGDSDGQQHEGAAWQHVVKGASCNAVTAEQIRTAASHFAAGHLGRKCPPRNPRPPS